MKLQVLLYHTHTHQTMLTPTLTITFLKSVFGTKVQRYFISVYPSTYTLYITIPAPEHTRALFSSKCVYFESPGYMFMWFPEFDLKVFAAVQYINSLIWLLYGVHLPTEHLAAT